MKSLHIRCLLFLVLIIALPGISHAQYVYKIKADTVRIYNTCDTAELVLQNRTQNVLGFLYNKGAGVTEFRALNAVDTVFKSNDTLYYHTANGKLVPVKLNAATPPLSTVLATGNTANNNIVLGSASSTALYGFSNSRLIGTVGINGSFGVRSIGGNNGGAQLTTSDGVNPDKLFIISNTGTAPLYSNNAGTSLDTIWHSGNHAPGKLYNQVFSGAAVLSTLTTNASGHVTGLGVRNLLPADIGAAPASLNLQQVTANGNTTTGNISIDPGADAYREYIVNRTVSGIKSQASINNNNLAGLKWIPDLANPATSYGLLVGTGTLQFYNNGTTTNVWHAGNHVPGTAFTPTLTGANVLAGFATNASGHVTTLTTRTLLPSDIGAAPATAGTGYIQNQNTAAQASSNAWISGMMKANGGYQSIGTTPAVGLTDFAVMDGASGTVRWTFGRFNAETGSNIGSDFYIGRFNDAGTVLDRAVVIKRATGLITFNDSILASVVPAQATAATNFLTRASTGVISQRTPAQVLSDIGAASATLGAGYIQNQNTADQTGNFRINGTGTGQLFIAMAGDAGGIMYSMRTAAGRNRWQFGTSGTESGSNAGGDFNLFRHADDGSYVASALFIQRSTGNVGMGGLIAPTRQLDVAGTFGATGAATLGYTLTVGNVPALGTTATTFLTTSTLGLIQSRTAAQVLSDIGAAAGNIPLSTVLSNGNTAASSMELGAVGNSTNYQYTVRRLIGATNYMGGYGIVQGGTYYSANDGTTTRMILNRVTATAPDYSPDGGTTLYTMWHANNHPAGVANSQGSGLTGATVYSNIVTNSAGHLTSVSTRSLTPADISAAPNAGSANYIQNQNSAAQTSANGWVSGFLAGATLRTTSSPGIGDIQLYNGNITAANLRWVNYKATGESSGNVGSDLAWDSYDNSGVKIGTVLFIKRSTGNIGIGNASPARKLDVTGTFGATGATTLGNTLTVASIPALGRAATIFLTDTAGGLIQSRTATQVLSDIGAAPITGSGNYIQNQIAARQSGNGFNTVGSGTAARFISIGDGSAAYGHYLLNNSSNLARWAIGRSIAETGSGNVGGDFTIFAYNDAGSLNRSTDFVVQRSTGNIGIGNASPARKLDVTGTFGATGAATLGSTLAVSGSLTASSTINNFGAAANASSDLYINAASGIWRVGVNAAGNGTSANQLYFYDQSSGVTRMVIERGTGNVGINTQTPTTPLETNGIVYSSGGNSTLQWIDRSLGGINRWQWYATAGSAYLYDVNGATNRMTITNTGIVGIGTNTPGTNFKLDVNGSIQATGFYQASLRSLKKNIQPFTDSAIKILNNVAVRTFEYKADTANIKHIGFIADEVPEEMASPGHKGVDQANTVALLVKALQETNARLEALKKESDARVEALEKKVAELETQHGNQ